MVESKGALEDQPLGLLLMWLKITCHFWIMPSSRQENVDFRIQQKCGVSLRAAYVLQFQTLSNSISTQLIINNEDATNQLENDIVFPFD